MTTSVSQFEAVGLALAAYTFWVLADTSLKIAGASALPAFEVIGLVGLAMVVLLVIYGLVRRDLRSLWPKHPGRQLLRACLDLSNGVCVVIALRHLPLALFYTLVFAAPMATTVMAAALLKETLEWKKGLAIFIGFAGVVIAVNPFAVAPAGDWTGYLACLVCVVSFSSNMVWSRVMTQTESAPSLAFFSGVVTAVGGAVFSAHHVQPVTPKLSAVLLATGLFSVLGSLCFYVALRHAAAATVSQFHYSQLFTGALIAYIFWHERLTLSMVAGSCLIIAAGAYTATRSYAARVTLESAGARL